MSKVEIERGNSSRSLWRPYILFLIGIGSKNVISFSVSVLSLFLFCFCSGCRQSQRRAYREQLQNCVVLCQCYTRFTSEHLACDGQLNSSLQAQLSLPYSATKRDLLLRKTCKLVASLNGLPVQCTTKGDNLFAETPRHYRTSSRRLACDRHS